VWLRPYFDRRVDKLRLDAVAGIDDRPAVGQGSVVVDDL